MELPIREFSTEELDDWKQAIFGIYERMRAKAKEPYEVEYGGQLFTVLPNVYAPEFFDDTLWYAKQLQEIVGKKSLLEIGTGTGVIAIFSAQAGAKVVATDINPDAAENARINAQKHGLSISVREGNLYEPLIPEEKFDFIFWAHPFNAWDMPIKDMLLKSGIDPRYESLQGYIAGAKDYLTEEGKLLLGTGDSADLVQIEELAKQNGYKLELLREIEQPLEKGTDKRIKDLIYELVSLQR
jgi:release factor glutamine methyltransferase